MLELAANEYRILLATDRGGAILRLDWRGEPLLRPEEGPTILDVACFPLVPFSNRIAHGRFTTHGRDVVLAPNYPGSDHPHPLHGFGWLSLWSVEEVDTVAARMVHIYPGGEWPWPYRSEQCVRIDADGVLLSLTLTNEGVDAMPAGLGFHPFFPRHENTVYLGLHRGKWRTTLDCLPTYVNQRASAIDWWSGAPVGAQTLDTIFSGREGPLTITEGHKVLVLEPSSNLPFTVVFTPADKNWFCVEPVSHVTNAVNRGGETGLRWLAPGDTMEVSLRLRAGMTGND